MYYDGEVHIEPEDQCFTCEYFLKGVQCPLLEALGVGVVNLEGDVYVSNCGFYKEFKRHLRVVEPSSEKSNPDEDVQAGEPENPANRKQL